MGGDGFLFAVDGGREMDGVLHEVPFGVCLDGGGRAAQSLAATG